MKKYLDRIEENIEKSFDLLELNAEKGLNALSIFPRYLLENFNRLSTNVLEEVHERMNRSTAINKLMRYGALPWSKIILIGYKYFFYNKRNPPIFSPGMHMVRAPVGGGKSLLSYLLGELYRIKTGLGSYYTSPVEKPRLSENGEYYFKYHRLINLDDYYRENPNTGEIEKIKKFNTEKHKIVHKDERHLEFNPRMNNTSEQKKRFIPQQRDEILMRHGGITHVYKYTQYLKLDSQDMQALTYMHEVETVKDIPLSRWLETGNFEIIPLRLKITTYKVDASFKGEFTRKVVARYHLDVPFELLKYYDTHAEKYRDENVPLDYK